MNFSEIDMNQISRLTDPSRGGSDELVVGLVDIFLSQVPERIILLNKAVTSKNFVEVERIAHKLKSGAAYVGAQKSSELAATLEKAAKKLEDTITTQTATALIENLDQVQKELNSLIAFKRKLANKDRRLK
jgi:HPt (histidine-containing phosphotransfer) domain-containing protein